MLWPINQVLVIFLRGRVKPNSVLHVCYPVHIVHYTVELLRAEGFNADYLALGDSTDWTLCDYRLRRWKKWIPLTLTEFWYFWRVLAKYQTVQFHFMTGISQSGWEWPILKRLGRKIVVYYSGCETRDSALNKQFHPDFNICEECDYNAVLCDGAVNQLRRKLAQRYADLELVTTPDMKDFVPHAIHFPFFAPPAQIVPSRTRPHWPANGLFRVVHATNHPGIEGTGQIAEAIQRLAGKGLPIEFRHLYRTPYRQVLQEFADADLSIGKMKMGYYANAQIEAICCGTPTLTWVRPDLIDDAVRESGVVLCDMESIEDVVGTLMSNPDRLQLLQQEGPERIRAIHDNGLLARRLIAMYQALQAGENTRTMARFDGLRVDQ